MKLKPCLKKTARLIEIKINKAASYNAVKGRLNYRFYNDEFLQDKIKYERPILESETE